MAALAGGPASPPSRARISSSLYRSPFALSSRSAAIAASLAGRIAHGVSVAARRTWMRRLLMGPIPVPEHRVEFCGHRLSPRRGRRRFGGGRTRRGAWPRVFGFFGRQLTRRKHTNQREGNAHLLGERFLALEVRPDLAEVATILGAHAGPVLNPERERHGHRIDLVLEIHPRIAAP